MTNSNYKDQEIQIDLQRWARKLWSYWWVFLLFLTLCLSSGYLYLRYTTYYYSTKLSLLIKSVGDSGGISEENILIADQGFLGGGKSLDNEIQILKSIPLMEKVIDELDLHITYYRQGNVKENELYLDSPIVLDTFSLNGERAFGANLMVQVNDNDTFTLLDKNDEAIGDIKIFGVPFVTKAGSFRISRSSDSPYAQPGTYRISISNPESTASRYASSLLVERIGGHLASSILELKLLDPVPRKAEAILNTLVDVYNEEEVNDENKVLRNTIAFIDERVKILSSELDSVEGNIVQFKVDNAIITQDAASSLSFTIEEVRASLQQISDLEIQKSLLGSLEQFLADSEGSYELIPANLGADNAGLAALVTQYNELLLRRDRLAERASSQNPSMLALEDQLAEFRKTIVITIQNLQKDLEIPIAKTQENLDELRRNMSTVPKVENDLLDQMRTQTIKENLFLFLLQKREEAALSDAVTTANTRTIDHARSSKNPSQPKTQLVYLASFLLGFIIPLVLILLKELLETKIDSEDSIKRLTNIPLIGRIPLGKSKEHLVISSGNRSAISESFRILRTRLYFINLEAKTPVVLITSSHGGEGKTFVTLNLGMVTALSNKKVILLGLDLRKPKLYDYFGLKENDKGVTNYLVGACEVEDIVFPSDKNPNLFCVPSGPTIPEFTELIQVERVEKLIRTLKEHCDVLLIDSPPIGLIADALLLRKLVDNTLLIVRHKFTKKDMLKQLEELNKNDELAQPGIILNGIRPGNGYYGYGKKYGDGYYQ